MIKVSLTKAEFVALLSESEIFRNHVAEKFLDNSITGLIKEIKEFQHLDGGKIYAIKHIRNNTERFRDFLEKELGVYTGKDVKPTLRHCKMLVERIFNK